MKNRTLNQKNRTEGKHSTALFSALCFVLSSLYIPVSLFVSLGEWLTLALALGVGVLGITALTRAAGSFKPVAGFSITVAILSFLGGVFLPLALFVAFISASVLFAELCGRVSKWLVYPLPLIPAIAALLLSCGVFGAILALAAAPCGIVLAYCTDKKLNRAAAVCRLSTVICTLVLLLIGIAVYYCSGELSAVALRSLIDEARLQAELIFKSTLSDMQSLVGVTIGGFDSDSAAALLVASMFNLLPAIIITAANILSYFAHSLWLSVKYGASENRKEALPQLALDLSPVAAIVYIISLVLSLVLVSDSTALYGAAAENMLLILCPPLVLTALAGVRALTSAKGPSCLGTLLYIGLIFALASLSPIVILATALVGAVLLLVSSIARKIASKKNNN